MEWWNVRWKGVWEESVTVRWRVDEKEREDGIWNDSAKGKEKERDIRISDGRGR